MGQLSSKLRSVNFGGERNGISFWCPGCQSSHGVPTQGANAWNFDNNFTAPTLSPSIKIEGVRPLTEEQYQQVRAGHKITPTPYICHSIITAGQINFCTDSTHALAGQTVPMPDLPQHLHD